MYVKPFYLISADKSERSRSSDLQEIFACCVVVNLPLSLLGSCSAKMENINRWEPWSLVSVAPRLVGSQAVCDLRRISQACPAANSVLVKLLQLLQVETS